MSKASRHKLKRLERALHSLGYRVLYEKGNFKSGYCMVEQSRTIVMNRFLDVKARIALLLEIIEQVDIPLAELTDEDLSYVRKLRQDFKPGFIS